MPLLAAPGGHATPLPSVAFRGGFGARFVETVGQDRLRVLRRPTIRKHVFQPRVLRMETQQQVPDVGPRFQPMAFRTGQDRVQDRRSRSRLGASYEEPVLPADGLMTERSFRGVVVDGQATVRGIAPQGGPLIARIGDGFAQRALGKRRPRQLARSSMSYNC